MVNLNRIESHHESNIRLERACEVVPIIATEVMDVQRIVLFGSTARAQATIKSDIDLAIIISGDKRRDPGLIAKWVEIKQKLESKRIRKDLDIICWWENEYEAARQLAYTSPRFRQEDAMAGVLFEGLTLYQSLTHRLM